MDKPMPDLHFRLISTAMMLRDLFLPRHPILDELEIKDGAYILDYGCGPGNYSLIAADMVGATGKIYSLDIHPLAIERVKSRPAQRNLTNLETILSGCDTGLNNDSMDIIFFYDIFHALSEPDGVLKEFHRVLKPGGFVSMSDHHMKQPDIVEGMESKGLLKLIRRGKRSYIFGKNGH